MTLQDRRKYPRFDVAAKVSIASQTGEVASIEGISKDMSAEGFCFVAQEQFQPGTAITIEIIEKEFEFGPIFIKGKVVWSKPAEENQPKESTKEGTYLTGIKVLGIRKTDEARFTMLYCERVLDELRTYLKT